MLNFQQLPGTIISREGSLAPNEKEGGMLEETHFYELFGRFKVEIFKVLFTILFLPGDWVSCVDEAGLDFSNLLPQPPQ